MTPEPTDESRDDHDNECAKAAICDFLSATMKHDGTNSSASTAILVARAMAIHLFVRHDEELFHKDIAAAMQYAFAEVERFRRPAE